MNNQVDLSSRIGIRAVLSGIMVSVSFMLISLSFFAAIGIWNYNLNDLSDAGNVFWISFTLAWAVSLCFAGFVAAIGARSKSRIEGALNGLATCCGSYLLLTFFFLIFAPGPLEQMLRNATPQFFLRSFIGDVFAFAVGIMGGVNAANFEQHTKQIINFEKKITL